MSQYARRLILKICPFGNAKQISEGVGDHGKCDQRDSC